MEKKVNVIILILIFLVALGLATHLFLTPSCVKIKERHACLLKTNLKSNLR